MSEEILSIPHIPSGLREAAQRGVLIPFVGAGASRIAGCPSWPELADAALRSLVNRGHFSHKQIDQIKHLSPRMKLSIALGIAKNSNTPINFRNLLHPRGERNDPKGRELYGNLCRLGNIFVTTNYDTWLDEEITLPSRTRGATANPAIPAAANHRKVIHKIHDLTPDKLSQPNTVIHLHGSLLDPVGMILTTQHYVQHYANDRLSGNPEKENRVLTFLEYLFQNRTVFFVGYGLEELEILEYVILKARRLQEPNRREVRHYLLEGFFSHEKELMKSIKQYYLEECGIQLIPYLRDQKNWDQLLDVVEYFARNVPVSDPMFLQDFKEMEDLLNG